MEGEPTIPTQKLLTIDMLNPDDEYMHYTILYLSQHTYETEDSRSLVIKDSKRGQFFTYGQFLQSNVLKTPGSLLEIAISLHNEKMSHFR